MSAQTERGRILEVLGRIPMATITEEVDALIAAGFGDVAAQKSRAESLTTERDALAARVAAVEALVVDRPLHPNGCWCLACRVRAALAPQPTPAAEGEGQP